MLDMSGLLEGQANSFKLAVYYSLALSWQYII